MARLLIPFVLHFIAISYLYGACHCDPLSAQEKIANAIAIYTAKVSDVRKNKESGKSEVSFDIDETYKGEPENEMILTDAKAGSDCAILFQEKESYLVYARWEWGLKVTDRCAGTKRLEEAVAELHQLGPSDTVKSKFYPELKKVCMGQETTFCCLKSVDAMEKGVYAAEPDGGCAGGTIPDRLTCAGSLRWCVPVSESQPSKKVRHGSL